ncbi:MAG: ribosome recycling factor [Prevotella sp.]|nr:ribosome recycling factor [Prevotella sp.]
MRRATIREFDSLAEKYTNYIGIMDFRFRNLCIKSDPMALLSVKVLIEGELQNIEQCADVGKDNDYQFMVFPKYEEDLGQIAKGILEVHSEFKVEGKTMPIESVDENGNDQTVDVKYLLLTMPVVNDDRYKVLKDGVDAIYQDCKIQMESANNISKAKFAELAPGETKEDLDKLDKELKRLNKQWNEQRDKIHQAKLDEIDAAHNKWLAEQNAQMQQRTEQENARGEEAAHSMKMNSDDYE